MTTTFPLSTIQQLTFPCLRSTMSTRSLIHLTTLLSLTAEVVLSYHLFAKFSKANVQTFSPLKLPLLPLASILRLAFLRQFQQLVIQLSLPAIQPHHCILSHYAWSQGWVAIQHWLYSLIPFHPDSTFLWSPHTAIAPCCSPPHAEDSSIHHNFFTEQGLLPLSASAAASSCIPNNFLP